MKRGLLFIFLGLVAVLLQGTLLRMFLPAILVPNFTLILVSFIGCYLPSPAGALIAFFLGLEYDLFCSRALLGPYAASSIVVFGLTASVSTRLYLESGATVLVAVFASSLLNDLVNVVISSQFHQVESLIFEMVKFSLVLAVVSALAAPVVFKLLKTKLMKIKMRGAGRELGWST